MSFAFVFARATESYALIDQHIVADFSGLTNDHAHAVIDEEAAANLRTGMDLDPGEEPADLGDDARDERHARTIQPVGEPVRQNRVESWIAQDDLDRAFRSGIFAKNRLNLLSDSAEHGRDLIMAQAPARHTTPCVRDANFVQTIRDADRRNLNDGSVLGIVLLCALPLLVDAPPRRNL